MPLRRAVFAHFLAFPFEGNSESLTRPVLSQDCFPPTFVPIKWCAYAVLLLCIWVLCLVRGSNVQNGADNFQMLRLDVSGNRKDVVFEILYVSTLGKISYR